MVDIEVALPRMSGSGADTIHTPADLVGTVISFMLAGNGSMVSGVEVTGLDTHDGQVRILYGLPWTSGTSAVSLAAISQLHVSSIDDHRVYVGAWSSAAPAQRPAVPPRRATMTARTGPCPCECNRGGFCGGCGHAGCGGRRQ
jgi:hypothetical protein